MSNHIKTFHNKKRAISLFSAVVEAAPASVITRNFQCWYKIKTRLNPGDVLRPRQVHLIIKRAFYQLKIYADHTGKTPVLVE